MSLGSPTPPGDGEAMPGEPGRFTRSLRQGGCEPGPRMVEFEAQLDAQLRAAVRAYERLCLRVDQGALQIDGLLLCDEDSPVPGQLADMAGASRDIAALLRAQARDAAELLVALRQAATAAAGLAETADALRHSPDTVPGGLDP